MRRWLGNVVEDFKDLKNLDTYVALAIALAAAVLALMDGWFGDGTKLESFELAAMLGLLGIIANSALEIRRNLPGPDQGLVGPVWRFFAGRRGMPELDERIEQSQKSVLIFGVQLAAVVHGHKEVMVQRATEGIKIRIAMLSPVDATGNPVVWLEDFAPVHAIHELGTTLTTNLRHLRTWHASLAPKAARNIEIRCYHEIPTASVILYDTETKFGFIHVEPILTHLEPTQRPTFWLRDKDDHSLYSAVVARYRDLWDSATPVDQVLV